MGKKKSPASLERKKLREKRERASALAGPDTIYLDYGIVSLVIAGIAALLDMGILGSALNAFFADLRSISRKPLGWDVVLLAVALTI